MRKQAVPESRAAVQRSGAPTLGLRGIAEGDHVRISWDVNADAVKSATAGLLRMNDGKVTRETRLDAATLHSGSAVYYPTGSDVMLQLQVGATGEALSVVGITAKTSTSERNGSGNGTVKPTANSSPAFAKLKSSPALLAAIRPRSTKQSVLLPPPAISATPVTSALQPASLPDLPLPTPIPNRAPQKQAKQISYTGPQAVKHYPPKVSADVLRMLAGPTTIRVRVHIDPRGRVAGAEALSRGNSLIKYLSDVCVNAARQWEFIPARDNDHDVPSETVLDFSFDGSSTPRSRS